jgi:putative addiction module component (TIGR02574 family)
MTRANLFDFSHLTPAERIELAQQLWDSLPLEALQPTEAQLQELLRRRQELDEDKDPSEPWEKVLDDIENHGA